MGPSHLANREENAAPGIKAEANQPSKDGADFEEKGPGHLGVLGTF